MSRINDSLPTWAELVDHIKAPHGDTHLQDLSMQAWLIARDSGWHQKDTTHIERIALIHSEVSEALELLRRGKTNEYWYREDGKPEGVPSELADVIIRTVELAAWLCIDLDFAVADKMAYNAKRGDVPARGGDKLR